MLPVCSNNIQLSMYTIYKGLQFFVATWEVVTKKINLFYLFY